MFAVTYEGWSFTRGSSFGDLTGKILVFWAGGRLQWHPKVWLYFKSNLWVIAILLPPGGGLRPENSVGGVICPDPSFRPRARDISWYYVPSPISVLNSCSQETYNRLWSITNTRPSTPSKIQTIKIHTHRPKRVKKPCPLAPHLCR